MLEPPSQKSFKEELAKAATGGVLYKKVFIESLWHKRFPVNFAEFLRTPFLQNTGTASKLVGSEKNQRGP